MSCHKAIVVITGRVHCDFIAQVISTSGYHVFLSTSNIRKETQGAQGGSANLLFADIEMCQHSPSPLH